MFSAVSRISPLEPALTYPLPAGYSLDNLLFSHWLTSACSNWKSGWKPRYVRSASCSSFLASCLLLLSGDVEVNPGPGPRHPCGSCSKAVSSYQRGIFFVSYVITGTTQTALTCQMRSTPDLAPVMKACTVRSVSKRLLLSIIPQSFHVWRRLTSMTPLPPPACTTLTTHPHSSRSSCQLPQSCRISNPSEPTLPPANPMLYKEQFKCWVMLNRGSRYCLIYVEEHATTAVISILSDCIVVWYEDLTVAQAY